MVCDQLKKYYKGFGFHNHVDVYVSPADHTSNEHGQYCK